MKRLIIEITDDFYKQIEITRRIKEISKDVFYHWLIVDGYFSLDTYPDD